MKEKVMGIKDKVVEFAKKAWEFMKTNRLATAVVGFSVISLILSFMFNEILPLLDNS